MDRARAKETLSTPPEKGRREEDTSTEEEEVNAWINVLSLEQAREKCRRRGIKSSGIWPTLRDRLHQYEETVRGTIEIASTEKKTVIPAEEEIRRTAGKAGMIGQRVEGTGAQSNRAIPKRIRQARVNGTEIDTREEKTWRSADRVATSRGAQEAYNSLRRLDLKFTGAPNEDPHEFLELVREAREVIFVTDSDLLKCMPLLLSGIARLWFREARREINSWNKFETVFREQFESPNYQDALEEEVQARTQGEQERVAIYLAHVNSLMGRLNPPWTTKRKLDRLYKNLLPRFRIALQRTMFNDYKTLLMLASQLERATEKWTQPRQRCRDRGGAVSREDKETPTKGRRATRRNRHRRKKAERRRRESPGEVEC